MTKAGPQPPQSVDDGDELRRFVRETLGCGCPDEVVAEIRVEYGEGGEPGLDVGGRLMVRMIPAPDIDALARGFPDAVEVLRAERDRRGFNRLRMVVAHRSSVSLEKTLTEMLDVIAGGDDRVHVHVILPESAPAALVAQGGLCAETGFAS